MPARAVWLDPETPEEQAAMDNFCDAIVACVVHAQEREDRENAAGEPKSAPVESSSRRSASTYALRSLRCLAMDITRDGRRRRNRPTSVQVGGLPLLGSYGSRLAYSYAKASNSPSQTISGLLLALSPAIITPGATVGFPVRQHRRPTATTACAEKVVTSLSRIFRSCSRLRPMMIQVAERK